MDENKKMCSFRLHHSTRRRIALLSEEFGISNTEVIERAVSMSRKYNDHFIIETENYRNG